jgi:hypothetical protein
MTPTGARSVLRIGASARWRSRRHSLCSRAATPPRTVTAELAVRPGPAEVAAQHRGPAAAAAQARVATAPLAAAPNRAPPGRFVCIRAVVAASRSAKSFPTAGSALRTGRTRPAAQPVLAPGAFLRRVHPRPPTAPTYQQRAPEPNLQLPAPRTSARKTGDPAAVNSPAAPR